MDYDNGFARAQAQYDAQEPPQDYPYICDTSGDSSEDCTEDHDGEACPEREPCEDCGGVISCRCDDMYEDAKEARWDTDDRDYYNEPTD